MRIMVLCFAYALVTSAMHGQVPPQRELVIDFEGNKAFSRQQLIDTAEVCLAKYPQPQRHTPEALDYCLSRVKLFLTSHGYLRAIIGKPKIEESGAGKRIIAPVDEGVRYLLGEIKIEGSKLISPEQFIEMLNHKSSDVASSDVILEWLDQKVKRVYADRGYIQFSYEIEPHFHPAISGGGDSIVDFDIRVDEGRLFTIRKIAFEGNKHITTQALRRALLIKEGEPFNKSLYEDSIRNLNQLGLFGEIDGEKDVRMEVADSNAQLDLIIQLKEKAHPQLPQTKWYVDF
ncbi:MAG: hypothetical protein LC785_10690 [Acidobacteria bacterium]|nr:hypothetical protein [Acidobacteriota bacterium]